MNAKPSAKSGVFDFRLRDNSLYKRKPENSAVQERSKNSINKARVFESK